MYGADTVREVFRLHDEGLSTAAIAQATGASRTQVRTWIETGLQATLASPMRREMAVHSSDHCSARDNLDPAAYAYLLGQYLGDGCISRLTRTFSLRVTCCDDYPGVRNEVISAMGRVLPNAVSLVPKVGCTDVQSYSRHWPCLFPQHGQGRKHERPIRLAAWQQVIALDTRPDQLVRGLIHSDGCRVINRVRGRSGRRYAYVRYFLTNESTDIQTIFCTACERLGIAYRPNRANSISVAQRPSVDLLDRIVGPKY